MGAWVFVLWGGGSVWLACCSGVVSRFCNTKRSPSSNAIGEQGHLCEKQLEARCCFCPGPPVCRALKERGLCVTPAPRRSPELSGRRRPCRTPCSGSLAFLPLRPWHCLWAGEGTIWDIGGSLYAASHLFVASYPGFVALLYKVT